MKKAVEYLTQADKNASADNKRLGRSKEHIAHKMAVDSITNKHGDTHILRDRVSKLHGEAIKTTARSSREAGLKDREIYASAKTHKDRQGALTKEIARKKDIRGG